MTDHEWLDLATAYALSSLDEKEEPAFRLHLSNCAVCQDQVEGIRDMARQIAEPLAAPPPAALWERVRTAALAARPGSADDPTFGEMLRSRDPHDVCAILNGRVPHRFTGIYRVDPPILRNLRLFDSDQPEVRDTDPTPLGETYCSLVLATQEPFATADSLRDDRVSDHPASLSVRSYCGVPLRRADGTPFGTLCHFDVVARPVPTSEIPLMKRAASLVMQSLETV